MASRTLWILVTLVSYAIQYTFAQQNTTQSTTCYDLAGNIDRKSTPCNTDAEESLCCRESYICLSNSVCYNPIGNELSRGACTDKNWDADICIPLTYNGDRQSVCNAESQSTGITRCNDPLSQHLGAFVCDDFLQADPNALCNDTLTGSIIALAPGYFADARNGTVPGAAAFPTINTSGNDVGPFGNGTQSRDGGGRSYNSNGGGSSSGGSGNGTRSGGTSSDDDSDSDSDSNVGDADNAATRTITLTETVTATPSAATVSSCPTQDAAAQAQATQPSVAGTNAGTRTGSLFEQRGASLGVVLALLLPVVVVGVT